MAHARPAWRKCGGAPIKKSARPACRPFRLSATNEWRPGGGVEAAVFSWRHLLRAHLACGGENVPSSLLRKM